MDIPGSSSSSIIEDLDGSDVHGEQLTDDSCDSNDDSLLEDDLTDGSSPSLEQQQQQQQSGEGFIREGLMRAGHPLNPFYLPFDPNAKALASTVHVRRMSSYPQFWNNNKLRIFTNLLTGPHLMLQRYDAIANQFGHRFTRYRPMSGLDVEHRCVMIDDVGRNRKPD